MSPSFLVISPSNLAFLSAILDKCLLKSSFNLRSWPATFPSMTSCLLISSSFRVLETSSLMSVKTGATRKAAISNNCFWVILRPSPKSMILLGSSIRLDTEPMAAAFNS
ncbi:hypothetical protein CANTEDRAFT_103542, partial [Yamadazyma tenuis ATCC 10573]